MRASSLLWPLLLIHNDQSTHTIDNFFIFCTRTKLFKLLQANTCFAGCRTSFSFQSLRGLCWLYAYVQDHFSSVFISLQPPSRTYYWHQVHLLHAQWTIQHSANWTWISFLILFITSARSTLWQFCLHANKTNFLAIFIKSQRPSRQFRQYRCQQFNIFQHKPSESFTNMQVDLLYPSCWTYFLLTSSAGCLISCKRAGTLSRPFLMNHNNRAKHVIDGNFITCAREKPRLVLEWVLWYSVFYTSFHLTPFALLS